MSDLFFLLFPELLDSNNRSTSRPVSNPNKPIRGIPVDLYADEDSYTVDAYLPGYSKSSIGLNTENGVLTITAKKKEAKSNLISSDLGFPNELERSFQLDDDVDTENVSASLKNGILSITLPKKEATKAKEIKIK